MFILALLPNHNPLYTDYKVTYIDIYLQYNKRCIQIQKNICNFVTFSLLVSNTNASRRYKKVTKLQILFRTL